MADKKISALTAATLPLAGTEVLPLVQSNTTVKVANNDLRPKQIQSNATSGVLQVVGPAAASTRVMTTPDANFTVARTDAAQSFTGNQTLADGNLIIGTSGKGIDFSADPSAAGMTSELLDDYEEGTWTPIITGLGSNPTVTYGLQRGVYTKVGRLVTVSCNLSWSAISGGSGQAQINGLPFTIESSVGTGGAGAISIFEGFTLSAGRTSVAMFASPNTTYMNVRSFGSGVSTVTVAVADFAASGNIVFTATYSV